MVYILMWMGGRLLGWSPSNRLQTAAWFCNRSTSARCVVAVAAFKDGWHPACAPPCGFHCPFFTSGWMVGRTRSKQNLSQIHLSLSGCVCMQGRHIHANKVARVVWGSSNAVNKHAAQREVYRKRAPIATIRDCKTAVGKCCLPYVLPDPGSSSLSLGSSSLYVSCQATMHID